MYVRPASRPVCAGTDRARARASSFRAYPKNSYFLQCILCSGAHAVYAFKLHCPTFALLCSYSQWTPVRTFTSMRDAQVGFSLHWAYMISGCVGLHLTAISPARTPVDGEVSPSNPPVVLSLILRSLAAHTIFGVEHHAVRYGIVHLSRLHRTLDSNALRHR